MTVPLSEGTRWPGPVLDHPDQIRDAPAMSRPHPVHVIRFLDDEPNLPAEQRAFYYPTWITMLSICVLHEGYGSVTGEEGAARRAISSQLDPARLYGF